mmetsp:Transcript_20748/g.49852  ORF Transcript_20748/g.49852 Transcript_20748/m.49852 type:complete len:134 (-) Transcript_20748:539-940(-)
MFTATLNQIFLAGFALLYVIQCGVVLADSEAHPVAMNLRGGDVVKFDIHAADGDERNSCKEAEQKIAKARKNCDSIGCRCERCGGGDGFALKSDISAADGDEDSSCEEAQQECNDASENCTNDSCWCGDGFAL